MAQATDEKSVRSAAAAAPRLSSARLAAVPAIYQMEMTGVGADTVLDEFLLHRCGAELDESGRAAVADRALFVELVRGVAEHRADLDRVIASLLVEDWPLERIEKVMAAILRAGAYELGHRPNVPARVAITEYVDVAHAFLDKREVGMVNGVLDGLARLLRGSEMGTPGAKRKVGTDPAG